METQPTSYDLLEYFNGGLSALERERIRVWAEADEKNRRLYEEVHRDYFLTRLGVRAAFIEGDKAALRRRLNVRGGRKGALGKVAAAIAAACVIIACSTLLPKWVGLGGADDMAMIGTVRNRAVIELSDGTRHTVGSDPAEFTEADGTVLSVTDTEITYDHSSAPAVTAENATNTIIVPRGADVYKVGLPDGSRVWLNADSRLEYPLDFTGDVREVRLRGEGFFEVTRNGSRPFIVTTDHQSVTVLGTEFNINAYDGEPVATTLVSGSVRINSAPNGGREALLAPGQQSVLNPGTGELAVRAVGTEHFTLWREGMISIEGMSMDDILKIVARKYDVTFDARGAAIGDIVLAGSISGRENLSTVLSILEKAGNVKFKPKKNGEITIERE